MEERDDEANVSRWTGWIVFAGVLLALSGFFHIIEGLALLINHNIAFVTQDAVWVLNLTQWGWIHIIGGALLVLAAGSVFAGGMFGRIVATIFAFISALINMAYLPVYPLWSVIVIAIDIFVIYAVMAHGRELKAVNY